MAVTAIAKTDYQEYVNTIAVSGTGVKKIRKLVSIASGNDDGSKKLICQLPANAILLDIKVRNSAITAGSDFDIGLYDAVDFGGAVIDKDMFADGLDLSSARARGSEVSGISALSLANGTKRVYELANAAASRSLSSGERTVYDLVLTANTVGTADGSVEVDVEFIAS